MKARIHNFTIIELLTVISIISLLAGLLLPALQSSREKGKFARWLTWKNQMRNDGQLLILYDFQDANPKKLLNGAFGLEQKNYNQRTLDGTINNSRWAWGRFKGKPALVFNGVNSYVQIPTDTKLGEVLGDMSISMWFYANSTAANAILMRFYGDNPSKWNMDISLRGSSLRLDYYAFTTTAGTKPGKGNSQGKGPPVGKGWNRDKTTLTSESQTFSPAFKAGKWYNVILTYSDDQNLLTLYVDGKFVQQVTPDGEIYFFFGNTCIGGISQSGQSFNGRIDEIDVFNKEMTAREVLSYYTMSTPY